MGACVFCNKNKLLLNFARSFIIARVLTALNGCYGRRYTTAFRNYLLSCPYNPRVEKNVVVETDSKKVPDQIPKQIRGVPLLKTP